jgi:RNA polymerase sigma-B factor
VTAGDGTNRGFGLLPPPRAARGDSRSGTATRRVSRPLPGPVSAPPDASVAHREPDALDLSPHRQFDGGLPSDDRELLDERMRRLAALPPGSRPHQQLRQQIVESQLPLVHHLAQRFRGRGEPYDDLVQVGTIGLLNTVDRFDPQRGAFTAFAVPTILGEIRRHFRDRGWAMRVPRRLQDFGRRVSATREQLTQRLGRSPTVQELAEELHDDPDLVVEAIETATVFATVPLPSASEEVLFESLSSPDYGLERVEQRVTLRPLLARLPARERRILALRFVRGMSQSQIAAEVGVSQMHVSRLLTRSLATLRENLSEEV